MAIKLKFGELLEKRGVTPNRLAQRQGLTRNTVYALANPRPERNRVDLDVLAEVMAALERESGQPVALTDVLELVTDPTPEQLEQQEAEKREALETEAWMSAQLTPALEPFDWGEAGPPVGKPVKVIGGQILVMGGGDDD